MLMPVMIYLIHFKRYIIRPDDENGSKKVDMKNKIKEFCYKI